MDDIAPAQDQPETVKPAARKRTRKPTPRKRAPRKAPASKAEAVAAAATAGIDNTSKGGRPSKASKTEQGLVNLHVGAGALLQVAGLMFGQPRLGATGAALDMQAEAAAAALASWAESNDRVRAALEALTGVGGGLLVLAAYGPVLNAAVTGVAPAGAPTLMDSMLNSLGGLDVAGLDLAAMFGNGNGASTPAGE